MNQEKSAPTTDDQISITPWSATRTNAPVQLPEELAAKNVRLLDPLIAADLYTEFFENNAETVKITYPDTGNVEIYDQIANLRNHESGTHIQVIGNQETQHYIMLVKGMDAPAKEKNVILKAGEPLADFIENNRATSFACIGESVLNAEDFYLGILTGHAKTTEVIGYSIGTIPTNYLAAAYGAKVTNIADLGLPDSDLRRLLSDCFNMCSDGKLPPATGKFAENMDENVIGLNMKMDVVSRTILGHSCERRGKQITLDENNPDYRVMFSSSPSHFVEAIKKIAPDTQNVETVTTLKKAQIFPLPPIY